MSAFTPAQLVELRAMIAEGFEIAVAASGGDLGRLLDKIPLIRAEMALTARPGESRKSQLMRVSDDMRARVNEEHRTHLWMENFKSGFDAQLHGGSD